jgi:acyl carrier protein
MMEIKEFIDKFAEIFDDIDASALTAETKFRELDEWSSITALSAIAFADEEFDVELKGDDLRKADTILDLFNAIKSKV